MYDLNVFQAAALLRIIAYVERTNSSVYYGDLRSVDALKAKLEAAMPTLPEKEGNEH